MTPIPAVSQAEEEYLETFFWFFEHDRKTVKTNQIAEMMGVNPSTVTYMLKKLSQKGLINYHRYYGGSLTSSGEIVALSVVRKHRLAECFLYWLGIPWHRIHFEACKWEHILTDEIMEKLEEKIALPRRTPYGAFLPSKDGCVDKIDDKQPLAFFEVNDKVEIVEILERVIMREQTPSLTLEEVFKILEKNDLLPNRIFTITRKVLRTDIKTEEWSHFYSYDLSLSNENNDSADVPCYLVNMLLARKVS